MKRMFLLGCFVLLFGSCLVAAPKQHTVSFGKWITIKWLVGEEDPRATDVRIRPLLVDGRNKEFTVGPAHDITDRIIVVQRMYRLNDSLQQEPGAQHWIWERGGWLLVDRITGKTQALALSEFDPYFSTVTWFRDYAAYCGVSDDGKKLFAMVLQLGKRKPILKKPIGEFVNSDQPDSACSAPVWQRAPSRVTFDPKNEQKFTYTVRSRSVDLVSEDEDAGEE
jgi:hypothetical protein